MSRGKVERVLGEVDRVGEEELDDFVDSLVSGRLDSELSCGR